MYFKMGTALRGTENWQATQAAGKTFLFPILLAPNMPVQENFAHRANNPASYKGQIGSLALRRLIV